jgi:hypothetical protein
VLQPCSTVLENCLISSCHFLGQNNIIYFNHLKNLGLGKLKRIVSHPKWQRFKLLAGAFFFSVILITVDIATDIATAEDFFSSDYESAPTLRYSWESKPLKKESKFHWGLITVIPIFLPLLARVVLNFAMMTRCPCHKTLILS